MKNNFIKTKKYKNINLYLYFTSDYDLKKHLCLSLLAFFIGDYSKKYPTKEKMTLRRIIYMQLTSIPVLKLEPI